MLLEDSFEQRRGNRIALIISFVLITVLILAMVIML